MTTTAAAPRLGDLRAAAAECGVIWAGMFTLGIGFGVLVVGSGLPWWLAPVISATMFAGSVEFILVGMLAASAPIAAIAATTFLVNSRHLFYGLAFPLHRARGPLAKGYSVFALCDEAFAILATKNPATLTTARMLWTQGGMHASWATGSLLGALVGARLLAGLDGLDFILTALFLVLTMDAYRANPDRAALALSAAAAVAAYLIAPGSMLLTAMAAYAFTLVVRHHRRTRMGTSHA